MTGTDQENNYPATIAEAVDRLIEILPLKEKVMITRMDELELLELQLSLGLFIRTEFGLFSDNRQLIRACEALLKPATDSIPQAISLVIMKGLQKNLQQTHILKRIK